MPSPAWFRDWQRTGRLPDGRTAYDVHIDAGTGKIHVCCDQIVIEWL